MPNVLPALLLIVPLLSGCGSLRYYSQAISGHMSLMAKRQSIQQLLDDSGAEGQFRERLILVQSIRDFATESLKLPENGSYRSFVPVSGEAVVWSLVATGAFSVAPKQWCYPVIGCASYRGYFDQDEARRHKRELEEEGLDVVLEPVPAYSTLGWFDDPLPGTVIHWNEWRLAGLIFHELAHQRLYVAGDSPFNEGFANKVQQAGITSWLATAESSDGLVEWRLSQQRERAFVQLLMDTRERLKTLYESSASGIEMGRGKLAAFDRLRADYRDLKRAWQGYTGYDAWFERKLNNAGLASVATYEEWLPVFDLLFARADGNFELFYQACENLAALPLRERLDQMRQLQRDAGSQLTAGRSHKLGRLPKTAVR